jgi:hypothetical protein
LTDRDQNREVDLKLLKVVVAVSIVFSSTLALAQNAAPQVMPSQPLNAAQSMAQAPNPAPAAVPMPQASDEQRSAAGGQTSGAREMGAGAGGLFGLGMGATLAIVAGIVLLIAAASDGGSSSTSH